MGKKQARDVDKMSTEDLDQLLGKHGNRKFAPTPMEHCELTAGPAHAHSPALTPFPAVISFAQTLATPHPPSSA